jgi:hypothetical protein
VKSLWFVVLIGCGGAPAATTPANQGAPAAGSATAAPADGKFHCHLNCSGQEKHGYGATEEEARAAAGAFIKTTCKPEDGQYFLVCDPPLAD